LALDDIRALETARIDLGLPLGEAGGTLRIGRESAMLAGEALCGLLDRFALGLPSST
jgi:hypothetical protein